MKMTTRFLLASTFSLVALGSFSAAHAQDATWKFDFGSGPVAEGYRAVTPDTRYSPESGFGFDGDAKIIAQDQKGPDNLRRDFCTGDGAFFFSVALPAGFYDVTVILGDQKASTATTVKAEARRLMLQNVQSAPGTFEKRTFTIAIKRPELKSGRKLTLKSSQSPLDWDDRLTLEFNGARPCICAVEIAPAHKPIGVFLAGDSTVTDQGGEPYVGWGQVLPRFFKQGVAVYNNAESGETLASFAAAGRLQKIWDAIEPGDYLLIQFGHNDQKDKSPNALDNYKANLKRYIDEARAHQAIPILVTPMERRIFKNDQLMPTLAENAEAMRQVGAENKVPIIDLNAASQKLWTTLGPEGSKGAFVHYAANTFPGQVKPLRDDSHFNSYGAFELARIITSEIQAQKLDLAKFLTADYAAFDPARPDDAQALALFPSPLQVTSKPEGS